MSWNYRIMRHPAGYFSVHAVYYSEAGDVNGWSQDAYGIPPLAETLDDLAAELKRFTEALGKPVLDFEDGAELL